MTAKLLYAGLKAKLKTANLYWVTEKPLMDVSDVVNGVRALFWFRSKLNRCHIVPTCCTIKSVITFE